jgi:hypothetical protein
MTKSIDEIVKEHKQEIKERFMEKWDHFLDDIERRYQEKKKLKSK